MQSLVSSISTGAAEAALAFCFSTIRSRNVSATCFLLWVSTAHGRMVRMGGRRVYAVRERAVHCAAGQSYFRASQRISERALDGLLGNVGSQG